MADQPSHLQQAVAALESLSRLNNVCDIRRIRLAKGEKLLVLCDDDPGQEVRDRFAELLGVHPSRIVFTSGISDVVAVRAGE